MTHRRYGACLFCALICIYINGEPSEWLNDWYEIEVIIFAQPGNDEQGAEQEANDSMWPKHVEELLVAAPRSFGNVTRSFPLTDEERARIRLRSSEIDFDIGNDPWFLDPRANHSEAAPDVDELSVFGTFPDWLLAPDASYDDLFANTFKRIAFGGWFTELSLSSLLQEDQDDLALKELEVVFEEVDESTDDLADETGPTPEDVAALIEEFRSELRETSFVMDEQHVRLPRTAQRLRSNGVKIIKHFNWHQLVPPRSGKSEYVLFQVLGEYPTEGYFSVSKGRFIHFESRLWMHQPGVTQTQFQLPVYELAETRRMRIEDIHYFDHPKFGMLAEVVRIELPAEIQALLDSLD